MKTTFNTAAYVKYYGHGPRGRGSWVFALTGAQVTMRGDEIMRTPSMTYTESKKYLIKKFSGCKSRDIEVLT